jgi:hypothetical protein
MLLGLSSMRGKRVLSPYISPARLVPIAAVVGSCPISTALAFSSRRSGPPGSMLAAGISSALGSCWLSQPRHWAKTSGLEYTRRMSAGGQLASSAWWIAICTSA